MKDKIILILITAGIAGSLLLSGALYFFVIDWLHWAIEVKGLVFVGITLLVGFLIKAVMARWKELLEEKKHDLSQY